MKVEVGSVWKEDDKRFDRHVQVLFIDEGSETAIVKNIESVRYRPTVVSFKRFGKSGGFKPE